MPTVQRRDRMVFKGSIPVTLISGPQVIVFPESMPNDYDIYVNTPNGITVVGTSNKTANGFTITLGISLVGNISWVAVEIMS